ncbi:A/G-specific adenine glycosylase [Campylobacter sp. RM10532]|uniref:A/G-specific adenine glycosylase n=1 Tax=Campylobacter molothri TaxID=1032242 RepID=A0ACC5VZK1_9BACT|nr:A/G-specific adenine glycosylase [Campylobacter sp. 2018MI35]MBZ7928141.1 A/G-specific adenine glycosylase [Campylobacter sp. RM10542]MBZ7930891.1 A/G-specific adenine glycosylase [Campylobacter sp. RM12910]MBZ7934354.1 A/G-specific adenine glycosylase [Campylobacter sp. W0065]MBZ7936810.1 A/G-specific adenine glycosylase [Campylobacter sp. RM10538]MBZ7943623.1 A/G-specific adenine glycosylase [Campylobacter sp. RM13744]MBZ7944905.1 A/G-specific adenine glycosylase [Campylobacter sp. RM105
MQKQIIEKLQKKLLLWYEEKGRKDLPWRNLQSIHCDDRLRQIDRAYGVYISEIMLQQTQVKSVLEKFYFPFLQKFPTLQSLANANEDDLLKAWQGLGYYNRARNLKKAALECMEKFSGILPKELKKLKSLSGIGAYTAGAIACFAYDQKVAFVDGNIRRVLSRLFALKNASMKELELKAYEILNLNDTFNHNQALLDIGALICLPKNPKCGVCPFYDFCKAKFNPNSYPENKKILYEKLNLFLIFMEYKEQIAIKKSQEKLYKGMYNFPLFKEDEFKKQKNMIFLGEFKHSYTKYKINIKVYHQILKIKTKDYEFKNFKELKHIPLSILSLKALNLIKF